MKRSSMSRRAVLRGFASGALVTLGLPRLEAMLNDAGTAHADGTPLPVRLVLWGWAHGVSPDLWVPKQTGSGDAWSLSQHLESFASVKPYVSVLSGTNNPKHGHPGMYAMFSGYVPEPNGYLKAIGPTMDRVAAKQAEFDAGTGVRTLEVGVSRSPNSDVTYQALSVESESTRYKPVTDPVAVFNRLFKPGTAAPTTPTTSSTPSTPSTWVLDACKEDIARLQRKLGTADRARLDEHLQSVMDVERQLKAPLAPPAGMSAACGTATAPTNVTFANDGQHDADLDKLAGIMTQVVALALACDRTRIVTVAYTLPANATRFATYSGGEHGVSHGSDWKKYLVPHVPMKMRALSRFLEQLQALREGTGNLLDQTALFATTDCTDPQVHRGVDMPIIIAGKAGGRLKGNVHHRASGESAFIAGATVCAAVRMKDRPFGDKLASALLAG